MPNVKNYTEQGGARDVIGGELDIVAGGALKLAGTQVTATAAELNQVDGALFGATFAPGAENATTNTINVAIQLTDAAGAALAHRAGVYLYVSADANGDAVVTTPVDTLAAGTDGNFQELISGKAGMAVSEADGDIDIAVTTSDARKVYLAVVLPDGSLACSTGITFA